MVTLVNLVTLITLVALVNLVTLITLLRPRSPDTPCYIPLQIVTTQLHQVTPLLHLAKQFLDDNDEQPLEMAICYSQGEGVPHQ